MSATKRHHLLLPQTYAVCVKSDYSDGCDMEYSEQSEPHNGIEYFTCRTCRSSWVSSGDEFIRLVTDESYVGDEIVGLS